MPIELHPRISVFCEMVRPEIDVALIPVTHDMVDRHGPSDPQRAGQAGVRDCNPTLVASVTSCL